MRYDEEDEDPADVGKVMAVYEDYLDDNYNVTNAHFYKEGIDHRNRFLLFGVNGIMSGIRDLLKDFPGKRVSLIWNEISKLSRQKEKEEKLSMLLNMILRKDAFMSFQKKLKY